MADTDTPETDTEAGTKTPRRRAPRKTSVAKPATASSKAKPATPPNPVAADDAAAAKSAPVRKPAKPVPKPRSTKRSTPRPTPARKPAPRATTAPTPKTSDKSGRKWGAAIAGGVAVIGAAAALLSLRGSTPKSERKRAHQADGTDSSKSFEAGIADEGTIPE